MRQLLWDGRKIVRGLYILRHPLYFIEKYFHNPRKVLCGGVNKFRVGKVRAAVCIVGNGAENTEGDIVLICNVAD